MNEPDQPLNEDSPFESDLRQFKPVPATPVLRQRLARALDDAEMPAGKRATTTLADRFFLGYVSAGAAAAVLIVAILAADYFGPDSPTASPAGPASPSALAAAMSQNRDWLAQLANGQDLSDSSLPLQGIRATSGGTR